MAKNTDEVHPTRGFFKPSISDYFKLKITIINNIRLFYLILLIFFYKLKLCILRIIGNNNNDTYLYILSTIMAD